MPHISFEYSANLEGLIDWAGFCAALRDAALQTGVFPLAGIRVRGIRCDHYAIADGHPDNGFIDISVRLRAGRPAEAKARATQAIFAAARDFLKDHIAAHRFALSLEMRDIDPDLSPKLNTIRDHMKERGA
ncbi:MAG: 5-carboxymethyl-2-hydroxymuconate Delta-isomerase [Alphaproteobacteria bacterium]|nr:MAG: 5-carboxymethyl-2-hydroxymuconate Delta-isomerase [Alphaproteobacteria bacterium]